MSDGGATMLYRMELDDETGEPYYEPITGAEFDWIARARGYRTLNGIDEAQLRRWIESECSCESVEGCDDCEWTYSVWLARQVLAG